MFSMLSNKNSLKFDPSTDIPSLQGKTLLITGGTAGLGKQSVLEFARHQPQQIWLTARDTKKAEAIVAEIRKEVPNAPIKILEMDLSSFASIKKAAATVLATCDRLDVLMLNAGTMFIPSGVTADGFEIQFGTNHMGHALLTRLLLPLLETTAQIPKSDVRIVCLASHGYVYLKNKGFDFETLKTRGEEKGPLQCYYQSKLANILWTRQFAKRHPEFTVCSIHPGLVQTELVEKTTGISWFLRCVARWMMVTSIEEGVKNQLWGSVSDDVQSGEYYEPIGKAGVITSDAKDDILAEELWDWTETEIDIAAKM
ncbi:hypothetical protein BKA59DRAFT_439180 [Fusarium tricinctum]|jgi:NAD(P)-dependent dehydrogenase (short-subunit alcohol dehydrogenase family)|uniref:Oxidoreductase n=1 Tax=Fusarium tricinctum TaxID=61284 RepID=A0A8K0S2R8_9HYPO|nr:hypothetical protein BKA59DRAFT_439180 [Fusarium tricinctum]